MKIKNSLLTLLVRFSHLFIKKRKGTKNILVISPTSLGELVWATPSLRALKKSFPKSNLTLLVNPLGKDLLAYDPYVDNFLVMQGNLLFSFFRLLPQIWKQKFDTVFIFHLSQRIIPVLAAMSHASTTIATAGKNKGLDHLLTTVLPQAPIHEIERRLRLVETVGAKREGVEMELFLHDQDKADTLSFLKENGLENQEIIGLHPGAHDLFKQWPEENFIGLAKHFTGKKIVVSGSPKEKAVVMRLVNQIPGSIPAILPLRVFAHLLDHYALFITNDTGPMHMAYARKCPTIALFCPTEPELYGPLGDVPARVLSFNKTCTPCLKKKCKEPFCMRQISVDLVAKTAQGMLRA